MGWLRYVEHLISPKQSVLMQLSVKHYMLHT